MEATEDCREKAPRQEEMMVPARLKLNQRSVNKLTKIYIYYVVRMCVQLRARINVVCNHNQTF